MTDRRIRQIVSETLKKRVVDAPTDHAMLQLARLEPALKLAAEAVVSGDIKAIRYYLKLLDQLDRYQPAAAPQAYDDEAREKLYTKMGRIAARSKPRTIKETPAGSPRQAAGGGEARENEIGAEHGALQPIEINPVQVARKSLKRRDSRKTKAWISFLFSLDLLPSSIWKSFLQELGFSSALPSAGSRRSADPAMAYCPAARPCARSNAAIVRGVGRTAARSARSARARLHWPERSAAAISVWLTTSRWAWLPPMRIAS